MKWCISEGEIGHVQGHDSGVEGTISKTKKFGNTDSIGGEILYRVLFFFFWFWSEESLSNFQSNWTPARSISRTTDVAVN